MRSHECWVRVPCFAVIATVAACTAPDDSISRLTDESAARPAVSPPSAARIEANDGSLAALTAEVRQLRVAVEQLARIQTEAQALGVALSAQQGRVLQVTQQVDSLRDGIDSMANESQTFERQLPSLAADLSRTTDREVRARIERRIRDLEAERDRVNLVLQQARARESDLARSLALEENRWNDLLSRMERLTQ